MDRRRLRLSASDGRSTTGGWRLTIRERSSKRQSLVVLGQLCGSHGGHMDIAQSQSPWAHQQGCIRRGGGLKGGGVGWDTPPPRVPLWSPPKAGRKILSLSPLGAKDAKANFWLSASNIGTGGGGGGGGSRGGYGRSNTSLLTREHHCGQFICVEQSSSSNRYGNCWSGATGTAPFN